MYWTSKRFVVAPATSLAILGPPTLSLQTNWSHAACREQPLLLPRPYHDPSNRSHCHTPEGLMKAVASYTAKHGYVPPRPEKFSLRQVKPPRFSLPLTWFFHPFSPP